MPVPVCHLWCRVVCLWVCVQSRGGRSEKSYFMAAPLPSFTACHYWATVIFWSGHGNSIFLRNCTPNKLFVFYRPSGHWPNFVIFSAKFQNFYNVFNCFGKWRITNQNYSMHYCRMAEYKLQCSRNATVNSSSHCYWRWTSWIKRFCWGKLGCFRVYSGGKQFFTPCALVLYCNKNSSHVYQWHFLFVQPPTTACNWMFLQDNAPLGSSYTCWNIFVNFSIIIHFIV